MIEKGCFSCAKTRGRDCNHKKEQVEFCRDWEAI